MTVRYRTDGAGVCDIERTGIRYTKAKLARPFKVPGGMVGMWVAGGVGFVGVLFSFVVALFPPAQLPVGSPLLYVTLVVVGTMVFCGVPLVLHAIRQRNGAAEERSER